MRCPKCQEGMLMTIEFKNTLKKAILCDFCESLWLEGEDVNETPTHTLRSYSQGEDLDYTFDDLDHIDEDEKVEFVKYRS